LLLRYLSSSPLPSSSSSSSTISNEEGKDQSPPSSSSLPPSSSARPNIRVSSILETKPKVNFTITEDANIEQTISHMVKEKLGSCLAMDKKGEISGIFTARDILRFIHTVPGTNGTKASKVFSLTVKDLMTKKEQLVFCSPNDSVRRVREMMFQLKIRSIPVIDNNEVHGIVTMKDLADSAFSLLQTGGKKGFIHNVTGRKGLPEGTKAQIAKSEESRPDVTNSSAQVRLEMDIGLYSLPHPYKKNDGCAPSRRHYGASELCSDITLCEDASFALKVSGKHQPTFKSQQSQTYLCVADGVGSWRHYGIDPRQFAHTLVSNAKRVIESDAVQRDVLGGGAFQEAGLGLFEQEPIHPLDVIMDAWHMTTSDKIVGSSTICLATIDNKLNQLSYSNLGDCGLMVLRHIDSETAGYMRDRNVPRHLRNNDLRIAYLSQQQLRSFNLPYQLGFSNIPEHPGAFENPMDADTASIPVLPGDIVLLATDGLFDNLDLNEIVAEISAWENKYIKSNGIDLSLPHPKADEYLNLLAKDLCLKARTLSLDTKRDSPFALLAKENDIMWGGGMPDDTSIVVARVTKMDD